MAGEDGGGGPAPGAPGGGAHASGNDHVPAPIITSGEPMNIHRQESRQSANNNNGRDDYIISPRVHTPNPFSRKNTSMDIDDYFSGPRDLQKHSKWPLFLQMHGSILPKMIIPLIWVGAWSSVITWLSLTEHPGLKDVNLSISSILLTVTGFVVGLGLSFRNSTAYERYAEGRRYWSQLTLTCQSLARVYWVNTKERDECSKEDLLAKITALNLLTAFAVALKHKLRYEPYTYYEDISDLVEHLETFARSATQDDDVFKPKKPNVFKVVGEHLGVSFAASNPRKLIKKAQSPIGNLPLEILTYLSAYTDDIVGSGQLPIPMTQTMAYNGIQALNDVMTGTERVLSTPLPLAYTISISQITWAYVMLLPLPTAEGAEVGDDPRGRVRVVHHSRVALHRPRDREPVRQRRQRPAHGAVLPADRAGPRDHVGAPQAPPERVGPVLAQQAHVPPQRVRLPRLGRPLRGRHPPGPPQQAPCAVREGDGQQHGDHGQDRG
ncbi:Bestrophin- RFP-TM- chloride channel-domain-containing protein [Apiospora arundinis]